MANEMSWMCAFTPITFGSTEEPVHAVVEGKHSA